MRQFSIFVALASQLLGSLPIQAQERMKSPAELVKFLLHQSDGSKNDDSFQTNLGGCGFSIQQVRLDRDAARSLVAWGDSAVPEIEAALDFIETRGAKAEFSTNPAWLFYTYARIKGPNAYPRLREIMSHADLDFLRNVVDTAVALSLGLTSYVDAVRIPALEICRGAEPRQAMDQMALSWLRNDRTGLVAHLGPAAKAALQSSLAVRSWDRLRADLLAKEPDADSAVGFRFDISGSLSEPEETLDGDPLTQKGPLMHSEITTVFTSRSGRKCGKSTVRFSVATTAAVTGTPLMSPGTYLINNSDIEGLLRLISTCTAQK